MIDSGKIQAAVSIMSKIPSEKGLLVWDDREDTYCKFHIEYKDHSVSFLMEHFTADPLPYAELLTTGTDLIREFLEKSIILGKEKEDLLLAFRTTFNVLILENGELKQRILELEGDIDAEGSATPE